MRSAGDRRTLAWRATAIRSRRGRYGHTADSKAPTTWLPAFSLCPPCTLPRERKSAELSAPRSSIKHMVESHSSTIAGKSPADDGAELPLERLEAQICELAGHLAAATCRLLILVGDFDARRGWASWDLPSCAAWLSWKCQIAPGTAREPVRVARALRVLPAITAGPRRTGPGVRSGQ